MSEKITRAGDYGATDDLAKAAMEGVASTAEGEEVNPAAEERDPIEKWRAGLKAAKITEEQAGRILDSMLEKGYWERDYKLFQGRVSMRLRTRDVQNINRILSTIDRMRVPAQAMIEETIILLNLAGSLVQLRDVTLPHPDVNKATIDEIEDAFDARKQFVQRLSGPLLPAIRTALIHFDGVVTAALANGAAEGF